MSKASANTNKKTTKVRKKGSQKKVDTVNSFWPFYSVIAMVGRRFAVILLGGLVVFSAITVANQTHQYRLTTAEYRKLQDQQSVLDLQWQKLRLEQSALAEYSRVEGIAEQKLKMKHLDKNSEVIVKK